MLTQIELKKLLHYNPETGIFIRLTRTRRIRSGAIAGGLDKCGYLIITINKKNYKAHRLAFLYVNGKFPEKDIDHINRIKSDNRMCNLREATQSQNQKNKSLYKNNKSGYKGVHWDGCNKRWVAQARINNIQQRLGSFKAIDEAVIAYQEFAKQKHGDFYCAK
jgi:hypothetical protein